MYMNLDTQKPINEFEMRFRSTQLSLILLGNLGMVNHGKGCLSTGQYRTGLLQRLCNVLSIDIFVGSTVKC